jgi:hypothetical protein
MPQGINKAPVGLLDFLGIKNFGQNPTELGEVLVPTFELLTWYLSEYAESVVASAAFAAAGYQAYLTVPNDQTWVVMAANFNSQAVLPAATTFEAVLAAVRGPNPGIQTALATAWAPATTGGVPWSGFVGIQFLPPGSNIGVNYIAGGPLPITLTVSASIVRCRR